MGKKKKKKSAAANIDRGAVLRLTIGVGAISAIEVVICLWLGMIPPHSSMEWTMMSTLVGGPIVLTLVGVVSYVVLTRLGVDVPTSTNAGGRDIEYLASKAKYDFDD